MDYQYNLTWPQARELTKAGYRIRRANWTDRWIFRTDGDLYWLSPDSAPDRVVQAQDFTKVEFLAADWTTMWPDQHECVLPSPDPEEDPPPPVPDPQPDPGGPITKSYASYTKVLDPLATYTTKYGGLNVPGKLFGGQQVVNPFAVACSVAMSGVADDYLYIYRGVQKNPILAQRTSPVYLGGNSSVPQSNRGWPFSLSFVLQAGENFILYALDTEGGVATYHLTATFTP